MIKCGIDTPEGKACVLFTKDGKRRLGIHLYSEHGGRSGARSAAQSQERAIKKRQKAKAEKITKNRKAIYDYWNEQGGMPMSKADEMVRKTVDARDRGDDIVKQVLEKVPEAGGFLSLVRKEEPVEKSTGDAGFKGVLYERATAKEMAKKIRKSSVDPVPSRSAEVQGWVDVMKTRVSPGVGDALLESITKSLGYKDVKGKVARVMKKWQEAVDTWVRAERPSLFGVRYELWPEHQKRAFKHAMVEVPGMSVIIEQVDAAFDAMREPGDRTMTTKSKSVIDFMVEKAKGQDDETGEQAGRPTPRMDGKRHPGDEGEPKGEGKEKGEGKPAQGELPDGWTPESVKAYWQNDMGGSQETCLANCPDTVKDPAKFCERLEAAAGKGESGGEGDGEEDK